MISAENERKCNNVVDLICNHFGIEVTVLKSGSRKHSLCDMRYIIIRIIEEMLNDEIVYATMEEIIRFVGKTSHCSLYHAQQRFITLNEVDAIFRKRYEEAKKVVETSDLDTDSKFITALANMPQY